MIDLGVNKTKDGEVNLFEIGKFDFDDNGMDELRKVFYNLLERFDGKEVFMQFRREEDLFLGNEEQMKMRKELPVILKTKGRYHVFRKLDDSRFDSLGSIIINTDFLEIFITLWEYFYSFDFFIPKENYTWELFLSHVDEYCDDLNAHKLLSKNAAADWVAIKNIGGESLIIATKVDFDVEKLIAK